MCGYNGWVSLEMEDFTMSTEAGIQSSIDALQANGTFKKLADKYFDYDIAPRTK